MNSTVSRFRRGAQLARGARATQRAQVAVLVATLAIAPIYAQQGPTRGAPPNRAAATAEPEVGILHVQGKVYLINLGDVNVTAQVGDDGILLVDSGPANMSEKLLAALQQRFPNKKVRYLINTSIDLDKTGGNAAVIKAFGGRMLGGNTGVRVISHENTLNRMTGATEGDKERAQEELPTSTFFTEKKEVYFNGEPIEVLYQPMAHTDGDVMVFFRGSDVISAGDLFSTVTYPIPDLKRGGGIQGILDGLNHILDITVPRFNEQDGTRVIPSHGRMCNESDVDDYRNWMTIVRDRIQAMVKKGMTLDQVKAAKPTLDYDGVFATPRWTTDMFVEAVYKDLSSGTKKS